MPVKRKNKHIHKYVRVNGPRVRIWKCAMPDCAHFMHSNLAESVLVGRQSICWSCASPFALTEDNVMNEDQPTCIECKLRASLNNDTIADEIIEVVESISETKSSEVSSNDYTLDDFLRDKGL